MVVAFDKKFLDCARGVELHVHRLIGMAESSRSDMPANPVFSAAKECPDTKYVGMYVCVCMSKAFRHILSFKLIIPRVFFKYPWMDS